MWGVLKSVGLAFRAEAVSEPLDVAAVHAAHAEYVWTSLYRLGVRQEDLPDMLQEVFLVVHRRARTYNGTSKVRTWLYGICLGVVRNYRRRAHFRREQLVCESEDTRECSCEENPEEAAAKGEARERLAAILDGLDAEKRAVFVMFELEGLSCDVIADMVGAPVGTVYSRLHSARKHFEKALKRYELADATLGVPSVTGVGA